MYPTSSKCTRRFIYIRSTCRTKCYSEPQPRGGYDLRSHGVDFASYGNLLLLMQAKPWYDCVRWLSLNPNLNYPGEVKKRKHKAKKSPNGSDLAYEPDYLRFYAKVGTIYWGRHNTPLRLFCFRSPKICKVLLIFALDDECWLFIEYLEGAHQTNKCKPPWQSEYIPNWPHLKSYSTENQR